MTKLCIDCKKRKPLDDFYRLRSGHPERQSRCKPCDNAKRAGIRADKARPRIVAVRRADGSIDLVLKKVEP